MQKVELLAPAGDIEKLKMAFIYGADAVYIGGQTFGLRASARNFSFEDMEEGIRFAHERGKKVYVTLNIIPHNEDLQELPGYLQKLNELGIDALILSDPGTLMYVKQYAPDLEIHLSTQANNTNFMSARFWYEQGIRRIILARELSFQEIKETRSSIPDDLELEAFVHGAMCISYSGRCLLSNYMVNRDANRGECAHPCRWKYYLVEEKRPGEYMPVFEDENGTYFFNSKDLCMIQYVPELIESGLSSLKIEGRMKSVYYVANIVRIYREAIDQYYKMGSSYQYNPSWLDEIKKASHRDFTTGFYVDKPGPKEQIYGTSAYVREYDFVGLVLDYDKETKIAVIEQRNRIFVGDELEIIGPNMKQFTQNVELMWSQNDEVIDVAPHAQQIIKMKMEQPVEKFDILRKDRKDDRVE
jgi:putative protease